MRVFSLSSKTSIKEIISLKKILVIISLTSAIFLCFSFAEIPCLAFHLDTVPYYGLLATITGIISINLPSKKFKSFLVKTKIPTRKKTERFEQSQSAPTPSPEANQKSQTRSATLKIPRSSDRIYSRAFKSMADSSSHRARPRKQKGQEALLSLDDEVFKEDNLSSLVLKYQHANFSSKKRSMPHDWAIEVLPHVFLCDFTHMKNRIIIKNESRYFISIVNDSLFSQIVGMMNIESNIKPIAFSQSPTPHIVWNQIKPRLSEIFAMIERASSRQKIIIQSPDDSDLGAAVFVAYLMQKTKLSFDCCHKFLRSKIAFIDLIKKNPNGTFEEQLNPPRGSI